MKKRNSLGQFTSQTDTGYLTIFISGPILLLKIIFIFIALFPRIVIIFHR